MTPKKRATPKKKRSTSTAKKKSTPKRSTTSKKRNSGKKNSTVTEKKAEPENTATTAVNDKKVVEIEKAPKIPESNSEKTDSNNSALVAETPVDKKPLEDETVPEPRNKIIIKVGDKTTGEFADLFEKAIIEGNEERNIRNYTKAEDAYLRAQSLKTGDFRAVYGLGNLYSDQGRWEEAEKAYKTAIEMAPEEPATYIALSFVLTQPLAGKNLLERYALAELMTRRAIELDAENALAYDQLGVALELQGKISDETLNAYKKSIELDPTSALAYAHLGRLLRKKGAIKESSKAYIDAIQFSVDVPTMILVADVMQSQQRYLESEQLLRRALREDPKNPTALFLLGRALTTRGNYEEAEQVLKKSAEISPNSFVSYKLLGSLYLRQGKFEEAEKFLQKALQVISPNEEKRLALEFEAIGDGYMQNNKNVDAVRLYNQAIKLDKERADLIEKLAKAEEN
jgi:superkiller protein 3